MTGSLQVPLQIVLRNMRHSDAIEEHIRQKAGKLEEFHPRIVSCRVTLEQVGKHQQQGRDFRVGIDIRLPGRQQVVVNHDHDEDPYVALREASTLPSASSTRSPANRKPAGARTRRRCRLKRCGPPRTRPGRAMAGEHGCRACRRRTASGIRTKRAARIAPIGSAPPMKAPSAPDAQCPGIRTTFPRR